MIVFRDSPSENWNRRRRDARAMGEVGQLPEVIGALTAAESAGPTTRTSTEAITIGVTTGVIVFVLTRTLDKLFFGGKK